MFDDCRNSGAYGVAQRALADLKWAVYTTLQHGPTHGLTNSEIGRSLGIYLGHVGHEGHIPRTLLGVMEAEGVVEQVKETKRWILRKHVENEG